MLHDTCTLPHQDTWHLNFLPHFLTYLFLIHSCGEIKFFHLKQIETRNFNTYAWLKKITCKNTKIKVFHIFIFKDRFLCSGLIQIHNSLIDYPKALESKDNLHTLCPKENVFVHMQEKYKKARLIAVSCQLVSMKPI